MTAKKQVARFGPLGDFIPNGIKVGDTIYLSGQISMDGEGNVVGVGDLGAQVRQAYANMKEVLAKLDATMDDVVDEMFMVTDIEHAMSKVDEVFAIRAEAYGGNPDVAQTMVQVAALGMPGLMVEIKCVARV